MSSPIETHESLARLVRRLDEATAAGDVQRICEGVKDALVDAVVKGRLELPADFTRPVGPEDTVGYGRRLLHHDPEDRYTVVVMVWGSGQGTPIHDHAGKWCVECVYRGRIRVVSYELLGDASAEQVRFRREREVLAGIGEAGLLIPPFDYHVIENAHEATAVTIHVYGGEMVGCHAFHPQPALQPQPEGLPGASSFYRREWCELTYTDEAQPQ